MKAARTRYGGRSLPSHPGISIPFRLDPRRKLPSTYKPHLAGLGQGFLASSRKNESPFGTLTGYFQHIYTNCLLYQAP
ncbi:Nuclear Mitotic Apparatus Protein 1 [Manis pentadactyla]|nr:Nuclear Mitotic Apparatus Protein 1 [Manis pentadactyla]